MAQVALYGQRPGVWEELSRGCSEASRKLDEALTRLSRELNSLPQFLSSSLFLARDGSTYVQEVLEQTDSQIKALLHWPAGWNGYDFPVPDERAVKYARVWAAQLFFIVWYINRSWIQPTVTAGPEGETVLNWRNKGKKLTVYISSDSAEYIKVWGPDIETQMSDGDAKPITTQISLWVWLTSE